MYVHLVMGILLRGLMSDHLHIRKTHVESRHDEANIWIPSYQMVTKVLEVLTYTPYSLSVKKIPYGISPLVISILLHKCLICFVNIVLLAHRSNSLLLLQKCRQLLNVMCADDGRHTFLQAGQRAKIWQSPTNDAGSFQSPPCEQLRSYLSKINLHVRVLCIGGSGIGSDML